MPLIRMTSAVAAGEWRRWLKSLKMPAIVIGISTDIIFTPPEMRRLASMLGNAQYMEIDSEMGHDGFLVEHGKLNAILNKFCNTNS